MCRASTEVHRRKLKRGCGIRKDPILKLGFQKLNEGVPCEPENLNKRFNPCLKNQGWGDYRTKVIEYDYLRIL